MTRTGIPALIEADGWMMDVLRAAQELRLPDWRIGGGFVRTKVWDALDGRAAQTPLNDIDVIYFDPDDLSEASELRFQERLERLFPTGLWSVTNQARMHSENGDAPYASSLDAMRHWPETATAVAVTLDGAGAVRLAAPYGTDDLTNFIVRPTPTAERRMGSYCARQAEKGWKSRWPRITVLGCGSASD